MEIITLKAENTESLDEKIIENFKEGWLAWSMIIELKDGTFIQQLQRAVDYRSDMEKAKDLIGRFIACRNNQDIRDLAEESHDFYRKIRKYN